MTSLSGRRALAAVLCSAAASTALLVPATAYADAVTVADPVGDPVRAEGESETFEPAPQAKSVDLVSTRFDYRNQVLVVRGTAVKAANTVQRYVWVKGGGRDSAFFAFGASKIVAGQRGQCRGAEARVNKETATYTVKIPARCFGAPDQVRVGLALFRSDDEAESATLDDGQRDGFTENNQDIKLSTAIARG